MENEVSPQTKAFYIFHLLKQVPIFNHKAKLINEVITCDSAALDYPFYWS